MAKKQPVGDRDSSGRYQKSWLWRCDECGDKEIEKAGATPRGWTVENQGDLENTRAACPDCTDEGFGYDDEDDGLEDEESGEFEDEGG